jgi:hypothetical protein
MNENNVTVTNIDIPFGRLVGIILKIMLAAIPAILLLYAVMFGLGFDGFAALMSL